MRNELLVELEHSEEAAELLECLGHRKIFNLADFRWGRADALISNDVAQKFYLRYAEHFSGWRITLKSAKRLNSILRCCTC